MQQLQQPLERGDRGRARVGVAVVEPRLDRLGVPVAEVVEGEVVELVDEVREVELAEQPLDLALRLREPREDPALLERCAAARRGAAPSDASRMSRATFQSLFASLRPSSIAPSEKRTSCDDAIFISP